MAHPAHSVHELLWDASYFAIVESDATRKSVLERASDGTLRPASMPEESTTMNLVRRLAHSGRGLGVVAVLHNRALEGGVVRKGKVHHQPSGADLELAVEVWPGLWLDLLLQAKRVKLVNGVAKYSSWAADQNQALRDWATSWGRTPGMLLYNEIVTPFVSNTALRAPADFRCTAFGACSGANRLQMHDFATVAANWDPFGGTPGGVSMCLDQRFLTADQPTVIDIRPSHFPLEHLAHVAGCVSASTPREAEGTGRAPAVASIDVAIHEGMPGWAEVLVSRQAGDGGDDGSDRSGDAESLPVDASVVIPLRTVDA